MSEPVFQEGHSPPTPDSALIRFVFFPLSMVHVSHPRCSHFLSSQVQMRGTSAQADGDAYRRRSWKSYQK